MSQNKPKPKRLLLLLLLGFFANDISVNLSDGRDEFQGFICSFRSQNPQIRCFSSASAAGFLAAEMWRRGGGGSIGAVEVGNPVLLLGDGVPEADAGDGEEGGEDRGLAVRG